jgi:hypothetical protein
MILYSQIKNISRYVAFEEEELAIFNSLLEYKKVSKKDIYCEQVKMYFRSFMIKGSALKYYIDSNG